MGQGQQRLLEAPQQVLLGKQETNILLPGCVTTENVCPTGFQVGCRGRRLAAGRAANNVHMHTRWSPQQVESEDMSGSIRGTGCPPTTSCWASSFVLQLPTQAVPSIAVASMTLRHAATLHTVGNSCSRRVHVVAEQVAYMS